MTTPAPAACRGSRARGSSAPRDERGVILVLVVILLVVMLGFAALVIDMGNARGARRDAQNAADAASLAAAAELGSGTFPNFNAARDAGEQYAEDNVGEPLAWGTCSDDNPLPHTPHTATHGNCISYDSATSPTRARVKIPDTEEPSLFGGIFGADTLTVAAAAEAEVEFGSPGFGGVLPYALYSTFGSGGAEACLKTGGGGNAAGTCSGPSSGNFGKITIEMYDVGCSGNDHDKVRNNTALGADHFFSIYTGIEVDENPCGTPDPNTLVTDTGNAFSTGVHPGLVSSTAQFNDGGDGRLLRGQYRNTFSETLWGEGPLDDTPIWQFIPTTPPAQVPPSCHRSVFVTASTTGPAAQRETNTHNALATCFAQYNAGTGCSSAPCTGDLFAIDTNPFSGGSDDGVIDLQLTPRFAYVPVFEGSPPNGTKNVHIIGFRAVYMHFIYANCQGNGNCGLRWSPGPWSESWSGQSTSQLTAWVFHPNMLPGDLATVPRGGGNPMQNVDVRLVN